MYPNVIILISYHHWFDSSLVGFNPVIVDQIHSLSFIFCGNTKFLYVPSTSATHFTF